GLTDSDARARAGSQTGVVVTWLTHLAQKTASHVWLIGGAEVNEVREQYPSGYEQAQADVDAASGRPAIVLRDDLTRCFAELEAAWVRLTPQQWNRVGVCVPGPRTMVEIVFRHLRDV